MTTKLTKFFLITKEHYEPNKSNNLHKRDKFLERHTLLQLVQEEIENITDSKQVKI